MPTTRERIVELGHAGFSKEAIGAILGLEVEDVVAARAGQAGLVSFNPGISVVVAEDFAVADPADRVQFQVRDSQPYLSASVYATDLGEYDGDASGGELFIDGERLAKVGVTGEPNSGWGAFAIGDPASLEDVSDPDAKLWNVVSLGDNEDGLEVNNDGLALSDHGLVITNSASTLKLKLANGRHTIEWRFKAAEGSDGLAVALRQISIFV